MAQAGFLPPFAETCGDKEKMGVLKDALDGNARLVVALPTFSADTESPTVAYLLGTFPSVIESSSPAIDFSVSGGVSGSAANNADVSSMLTDHDLQYQPWQKQKEQQQQQQEGEDTNVGMSVSDAFGSLGEVEDRPLPPLLQTPTPVIDNKKVLVEEEDTGDGQFSGAEDNNDDADGDAGGDDFGNFDSVPPQQQASSSNNSIMHQEDGQFGNVKDDDFGNFDNVVSPHVPPPVELTTDGESAIANEATVGGDGTINDMVPDDEQPKLTTNIIMDEEEDDFGGFEAVEFTDGSVPTAADDNITMDEIKTESSVEAEEDDDGSFGAFEDFEAANNNEQFLSATDAVSESNAGSAIPKEAAMTDSMEEGNMDENFGDFDGTEEGELNASENNEREEDVGFGDFGSDANAVEIASSMPLVNENTGNHLGIETSNDNKPTTAGDNKLSVFDALVEVQDAPLPSLDAFSSVASTSGNSNNGMMESEKVEAVEDDDNDDFGDFADHEEEEAGDDDSLEDKAKADNDDDDGDDAEENDFGDFEEPDDIGLEEVDENDSEADNDETMALEDNAINDDNSHDAQMTPPSEDEPPTAIGAATAATIGGDDALSAFDALTEVQDAPLPPLGSFYSPSAGQEVALSGNDSASSGSGNDVEEEAGSDDITNDLTDDDGFGDFEASNHVSSAAENDNFSEEKKSSNMENDNDNFGDFAGSSDEKNEMDANENRMEENVIVGDGETFDAENNILMTIGDYTSTSTGTGDELSSAFDVFGVQDAPLPSLGTFFPSTAGVGETATTAIEVNGTIEEAAAKNDEEEEEDDDFGDFEGTVQKEDDHGINDTIGDGGGIANDLFDAFSSSNDDTPLSSFQTQQAVAPAAVGEEMSAGAEGFALEGSVKSFSVGSKHSDDDDIGFGDFTDNNDTTEKPEGNDNMNADEQFGDFEANAVPTTMLGAAIGEIPPPPLGTSSLPAIAAEQQHDGDEHVMFGDFGSPSGEEAMQHNNNEEESFGQFEAFPAATASQDIVGKLPKYSSTSPPSAQNENTVEEEDILFGDFGDALDHDGGFVSAAATAVDVNEDADFGQFEDVPSATVNNTEANVQNSNEEDDDNFGQFEAFPAATTNNDAVVQNSNEGDDGNFGQFEAFPAAATDNEVESFGQFDAHANPLENDASGESTSNDFGTFEGENAVHKTIHDTATDGVDVVQSSNLDDQFDDDFGDGFGDFSSFDDAAAATPPPQESEKKGDLEEILRSKLGHEFGRLPGEVWKNVIISTVESDLQRGNRILDYVSNSLSSADRAFIIKSRKLRDHICALAEFVRVVRSITATIGELLCVDKKVDVQESTLPQWNDNAIIADAIVIEYLWSEIISKAVALGIVSYVPQLESVVEIRARALSFYNAREKDEFCQLTLQPLVGGTSCTRSPVVWNGKKYMACAANFCANRVPEHAI